MHRQLFLLDLGRLSFWQNIIGVASLFLKLTLTCLTNGSKPKMLPITHIILWSADISMVFKRPQVVLPIMLYYKLLYRFDFLSHVITFNQLSQSFQVTWSLSTNYLTASSSFGYYLPIILPLPSHMITFNQSSHCF